MANKNFITSSSWTGYHQKKEGTKPSFSETPKKGLYKMSALLTRLSGTYQECKPKNNSELPLMAPKSC